jgi:hypothetical protein
VPLEGNQVWVDHKRKHLFAGPEEAVFTGEWSARTRTRAHHLRSFLNQEPSLRFSCAAIYTTDKSRICQVGDKFEFRGAEVMVMRILRETCAAKSGKLKPLVKILVVDTQAKKVVIAPHSPTRAL